MPGQDTLMRAGYLEASNISPGFMVCQAHFTGPGGAESSLFFSVDVIGRRIRLTQAVGCALLFPHVSGEVKAGFPVIVLSSFFLEVPFRVSIR